MGLKPTLIMKEDDGIIKIRSALRDDFSEHEIVLNSLLNYYWNNNMNPVEKFLELFESVIKRTINELTPHKNLHIKYSYKIEDELEISLESVVADDVGFKIEGNTISLNGFRNYEENEDTINIEKDIETPEIVYKKYMERNN